MSEEKRSRKAYVCLYMDERAIEKMREISEVLGIPQSEVVSRAILEPKFLEVLEKAVEELKKLKGGKR